MRVVLEILAAKRDRPIMNQGVPLPARKYEPALELLPFFSPHQMMKTRYTAIMTISIMPIPENSIVTIAGSVQRYCLLSFLFYTMQQKVDTILNFSYFCDHERHPAGNNSGGER